MRVGFAAATVGAAALYMTTYPPHLSAARADASLRIDSAHGATRWAQLERQLLADNVPACREFFRKYFDARGYVQCVLRWGANDGPDDAFENFNRWPELHALGAGDEILRMYMKGHEGMMRQYTEARTTEVPDRPRRACTTRNSSSQSDWMHHGEGLQLFNRMALSVPGRSEISRTRAAIRRPLHGRGSGGAELRPEHKMIRSMHQRQPRSDAAQGDGPRLGRRSVRCRRGSSRCTARRTFEQFLAHYEEYGDVVGDHFLNLVATTLPTERVSGRPAKPNTGGGSSSTWTRGSSG